MAIVTTEFFSASLRRFVTFRAVLPNDLPPEMVGSNPHFQRPMKTLFLLHGYSGNENDWLYNTHISQLAGQSFNLYTKYSALAEQIQDRCVKAGFLPKINITSSKVNFMLQMTEHNRGISLLPRPYALRSVRPGLKIIPFSEPFPWQVCITRNERVYQPYIAQLLERFVLAYFQEKKP